MIVADLKGPAGSLAADLERFAQAHGLRILSIADLIDYRLQRESLVERRAEGVHHVVVERVEHFRAVDADKANLADDFYDNGFVHAWLSNGNSAQRKRHGDAARHRNPGRKADRPGAFSPRHRKPGRRCGA